MTFTDHRQEIIGRGARMLRTALGPAIARFLEDPSVIEVMLNPDGRIWIDRLLEGLADTGERLSAADGERIDPRGGAGVADRRGALALQRASVALP